MDKGDGMAGADSAGDPHGRRPRAGSGGDRRGRRPHTGTVGEPHGDPPTTGAAKDAGDPTGSSSAHPVRAFLRANPQVFVLLVICLVLGIGTFVIVLIGLATAGSDQTTGDPSGAILGTHTLLLAHSLLP